jgi:hypothetical protein
VGRIANILPSPLAFLQRADDKDKQSVPLVPIVGIAILAVVVGLFLSVLEHTQPLGAFRREAARFAKGEIDQITPSKLRGIYRLIAADVNDGVDKVAAKGGAPRRAADLSQVLGPMPAQPMMSAFSIPQDQPSTPPSARMQAARPVSQARPVAKPDSTPGGPVASRVEDPRPPLPTPRVADPLAAAAGTSARPPLPPKPAAAAAGHDGVGPSGPPKPPPPPKPPLPVTAAPAPSPIVTPIRPPPEAFGDDDDDEGEDEATVVNPVPPELIEATAGVPLDPDEPPEWRRIFEEFVGTKRSCGEPVEGLTYEKFKGTLRKNRDQLTTKHGVKRVKFSVYVKEGRAALKASPIKD